MSSWQHPVYSGCRHKILFSNFHPFLLEHISEIPVALETGRWRREWSYLVFIGWRVSSRVNKQLKYSLHHCGEIRNTQMGDDYIPCLTFSPKSITKCVTVGYVWRTVGREWWCCLVRKWLESWTERCDPPSGLTMRRLADLKIAINKQTPVNAPHTHVLLWRFSFISQQTWSRNSVMKFSQVDQGGGRTFV